MRLEGEPKALRIPTNGIELSCFEWNAASRGRGPTLFFAHATGFHARCYDEIIRRLGDRHVVAVDLRGHGRSTSIEIERWRDIGEDLVGALETLDLVDVHGVGHSMGAHAMVDAAALAPARFRGLFLFDPVIGRPESYAGNAAGHFAEFADEGHPIGRRRNHFESADAMVERFHERPPYGLFDPKVLRDYCDHGLVESPDGGVFSLACTPAVEASVYMTSRTNPGIFDQARAISVPTLIVRAQLPDPDDAGMNFSVSPTWPGLVEIFPNAREIHLPDATHFLPFEDPDALARMLIEEVDGSSARADVGR